MARPAMGFLVALMLSACGVMAGGTYDAKAFQFIGCYPGPPCVGPGGRIAT